MASPLRILVVDDEVDLLDEVASYLRRRGVMVLTAGCHDDGLRILNDRTIALDVLVTDARLPDGNGLDLIQPYIDRGGDRSTCVLMTGHLDQSQVSDELTGVRVFGKPFALSSFYREIKAAVETQAAA